MKMCIIKGKVTMYAETLSAMMLQHANANGEIYEPSERGRERAAILVKRGSMRAPFEFEYTAEDARDAGLIGQAKLQEAYSRHAVGPLRVHRESVGVLGCHRRGLR